MDAFVPAAYDVKSRPYSCVMGLDMRSIENAPYELDENGTLEIRGGVFGYFGNSSTANI